MDTSGCGPDFVRGWLRANYGTTQRSRQFYSIPRGSNQERNSILRICDGFYDFIGHHRHIVGGSASLVGGTLIALAIGMIYLIIRLRRKSVEINPSQPPAMPPPMPSQL